MALATDYTGIRDAVAAELATVTDIGNVLTWLRPVTSWEDYAEEFLAEIDGETKTRAVVITPGRPLLGSSVVATMGALDDVWRLQLWVLVQAEKGTPGAAPGEDDGENVYTASLQLAANVKASLDGMQDSFGDVPVIYAGPAEIAEHDWKYHAGVACWVSVINYPVQVERTEAFD